MNSKVIYTAIFNNYDLLKSPKFVNEDFDYVLFTDEKTYIEQKRLMDNSIWKTNIIRDIKDEQEAFMKSKDIKINPEKYLSEYKKSIYIDGSFTQIGDVNDFLSQSQRTYQMCYHPRRSCAYDEAEICAKQQLGNMYRLKIQMQKYREECFPEKQGLCMGGIIARHHNRKAKRINSLWWKEITNGSTRDQLSINYVLWKLKEEIGLSEYDNNIDKIFKLHLHL